jgi:hypothetical protein
MFGIISLSRTGWGFIFFSNSWFKEVKIGFMKRSLLISSLEPEFDEFLLDCNDHLEKVAFTPLEERIRAEDPALSRGISKLKALMGEFDFDKYINSLIGMTRHEDMMFLITKNAMYKSVIELRFVKLILESFEASGCRIMVMPF